MQMSFLTPSAVVRPAGPKGFGAFAVEPIEAGTTVAAFGGYVLDRHALEQLPTRRRELTIQIDDDLFMTGPAEAEHADRVNHSCDPTCGLQGATILVARRDIEPGEELTFDYATCDAEPYDEFECACGSSRCRGKVTGHDWTLPEVQRRHRGWFSPYLARRIAEAVPVGYERRAFAIP
jgi:SET domain-containing protein